MPAPWVRIQVSMNSDPRVKRTGFYGAVALRALIEVAKLQGWDGGRIPLEDLDAELLADHMNAWVGTSESTRAPIVAGLGEGIDALRREGLLIDEEPEKGEETNGVSHLRIRSWSKYQRDSTNADRQKRYRERKKKSRP